MWPFNRRRRERLANEARLRIEADSQLPPAEMRAKWLGEIEAFEAETRKWNKTSSWLRVSQVVILAFAATNLYLGHGHLSVSLLAAISVAIVGALLRPKLEREEFAKKWRKHHEIMRAQTEVLYELRVSGRSNFPIKNRFD